MPHISNNELLSLIMKFNEAKSVKNVNSFNKRTYLMLCQQLVYNINELSNWLIKDSNLKIVDKNEAIQECTVLALSKIELLTDEQLDNFKVKYKILNYLTTCMIGHLRQLYRKQR